MKRASWFLSLAIVFAFVLVATMLLGRVAQVAPGAQAAPVASPTDASPISIGGPTAGHDAYEFVGQFDQSGPQFKSYGYLNYVAGLSPQLLYTTPLTPTAASARFTFTGTASLTGRDIISNLVSANAAGQTIIYMNENGGASFANPASFGQGQVVAVLDFRIHSVLVISAPNLGTVNGIEEITQTAAQPFTLAGKSYQFGTRGLLERASFSGWSRNNFPAPLKSRFWVAGDSAVTGFNTNLPAIQTVGAHAVN
jgi:hypothetical protein